MMELKLEIFGSLCSTNIFTINGIDADSDDFGTQGDDAPDSAEEYGCGDMAFHPNSAIDEILEKYKITSSEYDEISEKLAEGLSFGRCGWCV